MGALRRHLEYTESVFERLRVFCSGGPRGCAVVVVDTACMMAFGALACQPILLGLVSAKT